MQKSTRSGDDIGPTLALLILFTILLCVSVGEVLYDSEGPGVAVLVASSVLVAPFIGLVFLRVQEEVKKWRVRRQLRRRREERGGKH